MSGLALPEALVARIFAHAERSWPEECCGVLLGPRHQVAPSGGRQEVDEVVEADNVARGDRRRRYVIAPELLLRVHKEARRTGREVVGYYHSHPGAGAVPSDFDRAHAWPGTRYLIVGLDDARAVGMRSWRLSGTGAEHFEEEPWSTL